MRRSDASNSPSKLQKSGYTTFGVRLIFMFAAFFAWILLDMALGGAA